MIEQVNSISDDPQGFSQLLSRFGKRVPADDRAGAVDQPRNTVKHLTAFRNNFKSVFDEDSLRLLERLEPVLRDEPIFMAGGAVLRALTAVGAGSRRGHLQGGAGDIDLFVCTQDAAEASRIAQRIFHAVSDDVGLITYIHSY